MNTGLKGGMGFLKGARQLAMLFVFLLPLVLMSCGDLKDKLLSTDTTAPANTTASNFIDSGHHLQAPHQLPYLYQQRIM